MALADVGEDTIVSCKQCGYAANLEKAGYQTNGAVTQNTAESRSNPDATSLIRIHTPAIRTISELSSYVGEGPEHIIKTLLYQADGQLIAALVRGDHEVNDIALKHVLGVDELILADEEALAGRSDLKVGFLGPVDLDLPLIVDADVAAMGKAITGANEVDMHLSGVRPGMDFALNKVERIRFATDGDNCPTCGAKLVFTKGIEVGHIFKLGTKYSDAMNASFLDRNGRQCAPVMGCYGIGVSRLMAAIAEQYAGEEGIRWPAAVAPYQIHLIPVNWKDEQQRQLVLELEQQLGDAGYTVLTDDRDERPGVKFRMRNLLVCRCRSWLAGALQNGMSN